MKMNRIIWGVFCILAAALVIVNQLGFFRHINLWTLLLTAFLIPSAVSGLTRRNFFQFFFSIGILLILYRNLYRNLWGFFLLPQLSSWSILIAALLLAFGFSSIFKSSNGHRGFRSSKQDNTYKEYTQDTYDEAQTHESSESSSDNDIFCSVSLGSSSKYIHADHLQRGFLECNLGSLKVFFDNSMLHPNGATLHVDCSLGNMELFIPRSWNVVLDLNTSLGNVEERARPTYANGPIVTISGNVNLGELVVRYV